MATLQYVLHIFLQIITGKILLQYVFAYVSSDYHFGEILPHTPCKKKGFFLLSCMVFPQDKSSLTLLANKKYFSSLLYVLPYVSSKCFPVKILQLYGFSSVYKLACCFWLPLLKNPARHSLQINYFPPACFWI